MIHELKLITIHQRNIELLLQKKALFGEDHFPMHFQNSLDMEKVSVQELEDELRRRLQLLLEKAATYGFCLPILPFLLR